MKKKKKKQTHVAIVIGRHGHRDNAASCCCYSL
jgi:hypothetical protein